MKKEINLEERKSLQLAMLKEIDAFCKKNGLRYSLAFGTLLGAIRHKGFIPWDDDLDIMMPVEDIIKFKAIFHSDKLKFCDVDTEKYYDLDFPRISHKRTYKLEGKKTESYGISIDLYVYLPLPEEEELFFNNLERFEAHKKKMKMWRGKIMRHLPVSTIPFFKSAVKKVRDYEFLERRIGSKGRYYIVAGPLSIKDKMIYDRDIFKNMTSARFEDGEFPIISEYDYFLTKRYGDYMQLPPVEKRVGRSDGFTIFYWKS